MEAKNLQENLAQSQSHESRMIRDNEIKRQMMLQQQEPRETDMQNHDYVESQQQIHLDNKILNAQTIGQDAVLKLQKELEARVQKDLDELTVIANNKYAGGRHVYDYQLVRLSDKQQKEEREALEQAENIYNKHQNLKKEEEKMTRKFESAEK